MKENKNPKSPQFLSKHTHGVIYVRTHTPLIMC